MYNAHSLRVGCLAQLGEHRPYKARVGGSIPSTPTKSTFKEVLESPEASVVAGFFMSACYDSVRGKPRATKKIGGILGGTFQYSKVTCPQMVFKPLMTGDL